MLRVLVLIISLCVALTIAACGGDNSSNGGSTSDGSTADAVTASSKAKTSSEVISKRGKPKMTPHKESPPGKLVAKDLIEGTGAVAKAGDELTVHYIGAGYKSGTVFDTSWGQQRFAFELGRGKVIDGWDQGIAGMRVGGRRELTIPPGLAYGKQGTQVIAPNATLVFVVDLLAVK